MRQGYRNEAGECPGRTEREPGNLPGARSAAPGRPAAASWYSRPAMKPQSLLLLFMLPVLPAAFPAEKTAKELQAELDLTKAKLAVADAKLALADAETALKNLTPDAPGGAVAGGSKRGTQPPAGSGSAGGKRDNPGDTTPAPDPAKTYPPGASGGPAMFFNTGVRVLNPFKIDPATHKISSSSPQTGGFLEIVASNIWAWQPEYIFQSRNQAVKGRKASLAKVAKAPLTEDQLASESALLDYDWQSLTSMDLDEGWDYQARVSFEFGPDAQPSAATVTGSGDIGAQFSFNKHVSRGWTPNGAWSVGVGGSIGAVTDRASRRVHRDIMAGVTSTSSFSVGDSKRLALLRIGFGYANIDNVRYEDADKDLIKFEGTVPQFESHWRPATEAEVWWPMGDAAYLTLGARIYGHGKPDQWTLYLGTTIDIPQAIASLNPTKKKE